MKIMSRDFTTREKIMLLVLTLILLAAGYYAVIDQPIRTAINEAKSQQDELNTELMLLQTKAASLSRMQSELDSIEQSGSLGKMGSYNNSKAELDELNQLLQDVDSDFRFENEEVIITAKVFDETALPENAEMNAVKLEAGSEKYEEAKQASIRDLGTTEDDEYTFYDVTFIADGVEIEVPDEAVVINMEFKNVASEENETQSALHIQETEAGVVAQDVTAQSADGTLKSVGFNF